MNPIYDAVCRDLNYWPMIIVNFIQNDSFEETVGTAWDLEPLGTKTLEFNKPSDEEFPRAGEDDRPGWVFHMFGKNKYWVPDMPIHLEDQYSRWANENTPVV